jgi:hypothetical protein
VIDSTEIALRDYAVSGKVGFRDGTMIQNMADGKIYLISENRRRLLTDPDFFEKTGYLRDWCILVSDEEANLHKDGEDIK